MRSNSECSPALPPGCRWGGWAEKSTLCGRDGWRKPRSIRAFKKQSPPSFVHARLRSAFSWNSVKKWYVFRSCFNLSTPYPDFLRRQASKEANAIAKTPVFGFQLPHIAEHSSIGRHTELSSGVGTAWTWAKFGSDSLLMWLPLGCGVWQQELLSRVRETRSGSSGGSSSSLQAE